MVEVPGEPDITQHRSALSLEQDFQQVFQLPLSETQQKLLLQAKADLHTLPLLSGTASIMQVLKQSRKVNFPKILHFSVFPVIEYYTADSAKGTPQVDTE